MLDLVSSHRITVSEMAPHVHSFRPDENKTDKLVSWLINWIMLSLECGKIKPYDFLPTKADLACHIGVSQGTVQNVYRIVEDAGYIESKQRVGTFIKDIKKDKKFEKLTSKRELAVELIKKYLLENSYANGTKIPSTRNLSEFLGMSGATVRMALNYLVSEKVLLRDGKAFVLLKSEFEVENVENKTLVEKVATKIEKYIRSSLKSGDKLPTNIALAKRFSVSIKTVHDALKLLSKEGVVYTKRGKYGTIVLGESVRGNDLYEYEKFEQKLRQYIHANCEVGDKLPPIKGFAESFKTSEKTIKKALDNLAEDGYITFVRGRYGGTFVTDIPQDSHEAYKWLAITPEYISNMEN